MSRALLLDTATVRPLYVVRWCEACQRETTAHVVEGCVDCRFPKNTPPRREGPRQSGTTAVAIGRPRGTG